MGGDHSPSPEAPSRSWKGQERMESRKWLERNGEKGWGVRVIEGKEVGGDMPIAYFFPIRA